MEIGVDDPDEVQTLLREADYIADDEIATTLLLADRLRKPILIEGPPGCGKTELAKAVAGATGTDLVRLQCYRGLETENAIYEWDYMKQFLRIRAEGEARSDFNPGDIEDSIFDEEYLLERPILRAIRNGEQTVLLIDEIDRASEDFEAFLLEVLDDFQLSIPELGTVIADEEPLVIITSNRTRKIGDALKRRCLYLYLEPPTFEKELEIVRTKVPHLDEELSREIVQFMQTIRYQENLLRTPGITETLDWAAALSELGETDLTPETVSNSLSTILKEPQDIDELDAETVEELTESIDD
ncbi:AAA family ATPase [Natrinema gelatinilyticum]|uniref:AAA family ATPase n=1 Tax=Natrinema gelatinilyticum TaxID=2961571 RepID=UPI0020C21619|nr:MoxR family ATPase [Natrinema gelatinilyticum]